MTEVETGSASFIKKVDSRLLPPVLVAVFSVVIYLVLYQFWETKEMSKSEEVRKLFQNFWDWRLNESPEFATFIGNHTYDDKLESYSLKAIEKRKKACESFAADAKRLLSFPDLDEDCKQNLKIFIAELEVYLKGMEARGYLFPVNRMEGVHVEFSKLVNDMKYETVGDYKKLISRLKLLPIQISEIIDLMREGIKLHVTSHAVSMDNVLNQISQLQTSVEESPFYKPVLTMPSTIDSTTREALVSEISRAISTDVLPSFEKLKHFLKTEYFNHLRPNVAVSSLPEGAKFYQMCLDFHLGFSMKPEEVHNLGLEEVERIENEMRKIIKGLEMNLTVKQFSQKLREDKDFYFESAEEILEAYTGLVMNKIRQKLPKVTKYTPKVEISIQPTPPALASGPAAYYLGGTPDGKPGVFYVNTAQVSENPKYEMVTLALHEAEPGHHLQWSYMIEQKNLPDFRRYLEDRKYSDAPSRFPLHTAYLEGWGLYSEYLGYEMDMYDDPYFEYGHLSYEMLRACRLVVDTGIHVLGWSREQAVNFMVDKTALHQHAIEKEVDRYITWPGQACAYKVGEIKIKQLRKKAETTLGSAFDVCDFHEVVLASAGPLHLLEQNVNEYIEQKTKLS